jgi:hypothetical protein
MQILKSMSKKKNTVVLEIGEKYLKLVYAQGTLKDNAQLRHLLLYEDGLTNEKIAQSIKNFTLTNSIGKGAWFICVIPSYYAIYKHIEIPSVDKKEINQIVDLQAGSHTPYPKNELVIDYCQSGVAYERYSKIMLVIIKRDIISKRYEIINQAGYEIDEVCLAPELDANCLSEIIPQKEAVPLGVLHIDTMFSDFIIMKGGSCLYIRSIPYGAEGLKNQGEGKGILIDEIKKSLESYQASDIAEMPSIIYICGRKKLSESAAAELSSLSSVNIQILDFESLPDNFAGVFKQTKNDLDASFLPVFAPIFARDRSRMSFVPDDIKMKNHIKKSSQDAMRLGLFSVILFVVFSAVFLTNIAVKDLYLKRIRSEYAREEQQVRELEEITTHTRTIKEFLRRKGSILNVLSELYSSIPEEAYLSSIKYTGENTLSFTGTAGSMSRIFSLVTELENNAFFKDVKVDFTRSRRQAGQEVSDFGLTLVFVR